MTMITLDPSILASLGMPRIYQLGMVVRSINDSVAFYSKFLGIRPWYRGNVAE
jgi:hypothetical protein